MAVSAQTRFLRVNPALAVSYGDAVRAATAGGRRAAGIQAIQTFVGSGWKLVLTRDGVTVLRVAGSGLLPIVGTDIVITAANTGATELISDASIASGAWRAQVTKSDGTVCISGLCTAVGGGGGFTLSSDLDDAAGAAVSVVTFSLPASLDTNAPQEVVALNVGGASHTAVSGRQFLADIYSSGGSIASTASPVAGTDDDTLYQTERWGAFTYTIPVTAATYEVTLHMAEIWTGITGPGQRVFTVKLQPGTAQEVVISDIDLYATAGFLTAYDIVRTVQVTGSSLVVQTIAQTQNPKLGAISLRSPNGGTYVPSGTGGGTGGTLTPPGTVQTSIRVNSPKAVSSNFVGIHAFRYPWNTQDGSGVQTAAPTYGFGHRRNLNWHGAFWRSIETSQGVYDFAALDRLMATLPANAKLIFVLIGTPEYQQAPADTNATSPWPSWPGSNTPPINTTAMMAFVTALATRASVQGRIMGVEVWNEPEESFYDYGDGVNYNYFITSPRGNVGSYFTPGSNAYQRAQKLGEMLKALYQGIKGSADSRVNSLVVAGPSFVYGPPDGESVEFWYNNVAIPSGGLAKNYCDAFTTHHYPSSTSTQSMYNTLNHHRANWQNSLPGKPWWITESGHESISGGLTVAQHASMIRRRGMLAAALGCDALTYYAHDDSSNLGDPSTNAATRDALDWVHTQIAGQTIIDAAILSDDSIWVNLSSGTQHRVYVDGTVETTNVPASAVFYVGGHQHGMSSALERYTGGSAWNYRVIRNHNAEYLQTWTGGQVGWWTGISGSTNTYDWARLDAWCDYHAGKGRRLLLNIYSNPNWDAPDDSSIARNSTADSWGRAGGSSYVRSAYRENYRQMVADTVSRIVSRMPANFLIAVEAWNEPIGGESNNDSQFLKANGYPAYSGTSSIQTLLADITDDIHNGLRRVSQTIPLLVGVGAWAGSWLTKTIASRTSSGTLMLSFGDGFSFHPYGRSDQWASPVGATLTQLHNEIRAALPAPYTDMPLWATECAMFAPFNGGNDADQWRSWYDTNKTDLAQKQYNWIKEFKDLGWVCCITYSVDSGWSNTVANTWIGGEAGSYQFLGLSGLDMNGAINTQIASKLQQAADDLNYWSVG